MATQRPAYVHVDQDNFTQYFDLNGSATYDKPTGIVTVTPDKNDQVGNFALKPKIDASTNFTLLGQVNLGNRTSATGGADGIGFAFHNGNSTDIGNAGDNLGIGGLIDALGLKLDTWHNGDTCLKHYGRAHKCQRRMLMVMVEQMILILRNLVVS